MFDLLGSVRTALEAAAAEFDAAACTGPEAVQLLDQLGAIRRLTDGMLAKAAKRVADTNAHAQHGDRSAAELCGRVVGVSSSEAQRAIDNATKLETLLETDTAVRDGRLSARHAEMIASVAMHDPMVQQDLIEIAEQGIIPLRDACIAARARTEDPERRARRQHAARTFRIWSAADGMVEGHFRLTPEVGGGVRAVVMAATQRIFRSAPRAEGVRESHAAYAADALAELIVGGTAGHVSDHSVHVLIDHAALVRGNTEDGETCEIPGVGPVNVGWVRELLGNAFVTAIVKRGKDITSVTHFGRHIPAELRTAMIVAGRECQVMGCTGREYLELDHCDVDFARGGPTARWNLAWLCSVHHRRKTRGWRLGPLDPVSGKRFLHPPDAARAA